MGYVCVLLRSGHRNIPITVRVLMNCRCEPLTSATQWGRNISPPKWCAVSFQFCTGNGRKFSNIYSPVPCTMFLISFRSQSKLLFWVNCTTCIFFSSNWNLYTLFYPLSSRGQTTGFLFQLYSRICNLGSLLKFKFLILKFRGLSPRAKYTYRATAACQRS
jgi:hypothetical protein